MAVPIITGKLYSVEKSTNKAGETVGYKMMIIDGNNMPPQFVFIGADYAKVVFQWLKKGMFALFSVRSTSTTVEGKKGAKDKYYLNFTCTGVTNAHEVVPFEEKEKDEPKKKIAPKKTTTTVKEDNNDDDDLADLLD